MKAIAKHHVVGVYPRKGSPTVRTTNGSWLPRKDVEIVDHVIDFSEFRFCKDIPLREWVILQDDDIAIAYYGARTCRTPIPAGALVKRFSKGSPSSTGTLGIIFPVGD